MSQPPPQSFLLRLWREQERAPLRATLIAIAQPEEQRHFASLMELHIFLCAQDKTAAENHPGPSNCTR
jgi:hypothetical protein